MIDMLCNYEKRLNTNVEMILFFCFLLNSYIHKKHLKLPS